ncbi:hypothetical protein K438DRAFT_1814175, partial [Mycena galopus ATCC 62051]
IRVSARNHAHLLHHRAGSRELVFASPHPVGCPSPVASHCWIIWGVHQGPQAGGGCEKAGYACAGPPPLRPRLWAAVGASDARGRSGAWKRGSKTRIMCVGASGLLCFGPIAPSVSALWRAARWATSAHARGRCVLCRGRAPYNIAMKIQTNAYKNARGGRRGAGGNELARCPQDSRCSHRYLKRRSTLGQCASLARRIRRTRCFEQPGRAQRGWERTREVALGGRETSRHAVPRGSTIPALLNLQCAWVPLVAQPCMITAA